MDQGLTARTVKVLRMAEGEYAVVATDAADNGMVLWLSPELATQAIIGLLQVAYVDGPEPPPFVAGATPDTDGAPFHRIDLGGSLEDRRATVTIRSGDLAIPLLLDPPELRRLATGLAELATVLERTHAPRTGLPS